MSTNKEEYFIISTQQGDFKTKKLTPTHLRRKKWERPNPLHVMSYIPGTVVEFKVAVGDKVKEGDILLIYKAMKMNNLVRSAIDGTVKCLSVAPGENVPKGTLLLEFE